VKARGNTLWGICRFEWAATENGRNGIQREGVRATYHTRGNGALGEPMHYSTVSGPLRVKRRRIMPTTVHLCDFPHTAAACRSIHGTIAIECFGPCEVGA